nr:unnamed protein product [Callosobruchus analis]
MSFSGPMIWRELRCHFTDTHFCMTSTVGLSSKIKVTADSVSRQLHLVTQAELDDLVGDVELPKAKYQLLGLRLQQ